MALDAAGMRVIYIAPNHDIIEENVDHSTFRNYTFLHLHGREKCCLVPEYKKLAKQGLDISSLCESCSFLNEPCQYKTTYERAYRERPNLGLCHAHINNFLPRFLDTVTGPNRTIKDDYDCIIIDENPIGVFNQQKQLSMERLVQLREVFQIVNIEDEFIQILNEFGKELLDYNAIRRINLGHLKEIEVNKRYTKRLAKAITDGVITQVPPDIISFLFSMWKYMTEDNVRYMIYKTNNIINLTFFNSNPLDLGMKIIGLDGTASKIVWDHMLHDNLVEGETLFRIDNTYCFDPDNNGYSMAYQCNGARYPISSWRRSEETAKRLCEYFDLIAAQSEGKVLMIGTQFVNNKVGKYMTAKNIDFAKYYNLRSFNKYYKECDTVIIACEPNIPPDKMESCMALSGWDYETWRRIYTEEEMLQAIGRLRANIGITPSGRIRNVPLKVYIFPSTGIKQYCELCKKTYSREVMRCDCGQLLQYTPTLLPEARLISLYKIKTMEIFGKEFIDDDQLMRVKILCACPTNPYKLYDGSISKRKLQNKFDNLVEDGSIEHEKGGLYKLTRKGFNQLPQTEKETRQGSV